MTSANLPTAYLQQEHITIIPFTFHADGDEQACLTSIPSTRRPLCADRAGTKVSTSRSRRALSRRADPDAEAGEDVLFVSMSSGISGSYASGQIAARQLREEFPARKLLLVDTYSASLGEGLLVMRAVDCRREGDEHRRHLHPSAFAAAPHGADLHGRRPALPPQDRPPVQLEAVGTVLQIKPLLKGDPQGKIVCFAKLRGRQRAIEAIAKRYEELVRDAETQTVGIGALPTAHLTRRSSPRCRAGAAARRSRSCWWTTSR
ncbi:MAG: DegV family protein [Blautia wexlerae]